MKSLNHNIADNTSYSELSKAVSEICRTKSGSSLSTAIGNIFEDTVTGDILAEFGHISLSCGQLDEAIMLYRHAIKLGTTYEIFEHLARAVFPGSNYREHLSALHVLLKPKYYLEIGVFEGETLALARRGTVSVGVDPAPRLAADRRYEADTTIHRIPSDTYFIERTLLPKASIQAFDLCFIDGLHHFDQALRDFINVERVCHNRSVILIHDTLPVAPVPAQRECASRYWCGDVWKILPCLRHYRPDLTLITIPTFPSGLTIVLGVKPEAAMTDELFNEAVKRFNELPFDDGSGPDSLIGEAHALHRSNSPNDLSRMVNTLLSSITNDFKSEI